MQEKYRENLQIDSIFNSDEANNLNMKIFYNLNRVLSLLIRNLNSKDRKTKTGFILKQLTKYIFYFCFKMGRSINNFKRNHAFFNKAHNKRYFAS